jgi:hypothetical protein
MQMLASLKYDEYGGYGPGVKFAENLARWLNQFEPDQREIAYGFVMSRLVFISDGEMAHLIDIAYPDLIDPYLLNRSAADIGLPTYKIAKIAEHPDYVSLRRRSLFLGLSDGARLDRLRRASHLSHEQFGQDYEVHGDQAERFKTELEKALEAQHLPGDATFRQIFLVDDFSGSGRTLLRPDADNAGKYKGKLVRFRERLDDLKSNGIVSEDVAVAVLLYVASEQSVEHLTEMKSKVGLDDWTVAVVQKIGRHLRVDLTDPSMAELCKEYYDPSSADEHKSDAPIGYDDCALPLVLGHNTPNNSICLLWLETDTIDGLGRKALFPRYERHHKDRP